MRTRKTNVASTTYRGANGKHISDFSPHKNHGVYIYHFLFLNTYGRASTFCSLRFKCPLLVPGHLFHELLTCSVFLDISTNPDVLSQISSCSKIK
jgi:hypothetical protein